MEKVQNLLNFSDFEKNWRAKEPKKTKRTEVGLDIIEEKFLDEDEITEDEIIDDDEIIDQDDEELIDAKKLEGEEDDWKERILVLVDEIVESGVDPEEVYEFLDELGDEDEGEEVDIEDEDEEEVIDEEEVANDEEGEEVQESVKNFKNWNK
jgi:hypothetical protein